VHIKLKKLNDSFQEVKIYKNLGKVSPTFPAALFSVDARFAR